MCLRDLGNSECGCSLAKSLLECDISKPSSDMVLEGMWIEDKLGLIIIDCFPELIEDSW